MDEASLVVMSRLSVGFQCPNASCLSTYEQTYYGILVVNDEAVGHKLRCRSCQYSWFAPYWGDGELIVDSSTDKYIVVERES